MHAWPCHIVQVRGYVSCGMSYMNRNFTDVLKLSILTTQHMFLCVDLHHHATSIQNRGKKSIREFLK